MGRQLKQLKLLVKKNFEILLQRKVGVAFELFLPCVMLFVFSFLRNVLENESACMGSYRPINPFMDIWDDTQDHKIIAMVPDSSFVQNISDKMLELHAYQLYNSSNTTDGSVTKITLDEANYDTQLAGIKNGSTHHVVIFPSKTLLETVLKSDSGYFKAAVVFEDNETDSNDIRYTFRYHQSESDYWDTWKTHSLYTDADWSSFIGKQLATPYEWSGFVSLQQLVDTSIMILKDATYIPSIVLRATPTPGYTSDTFVSVQQGLVALTLLIGSFIMAASLSTDIIEEKCSKMREIMRMMGLSDKTMWVGWFIQRLFFIVIIPLLNALVLTNCGYYPNSDVTVIFFLLFLYYLTYTFFLFFVSSFQHNIKTASFAMIALTFLTYIPFSMKNGKLDTLSDMTRKTMCVCPLSGLLIGLNTVSNWEVVGLGAQWNNIGTGISSISTFSVSDVMIMLFIDMLLFSFLAWYIENVFPGEYGVANKPYFFLTRSFWCGNRPTTKVDYSGEEEVAYEDPTCHEKVPKDATAGITIRNLNKTFSTLDGPKVAVNRLSVEMFEGQVTALLGHNGAGKTTTINVLTGMFPPTSGDALVDGHSILTDMPGVRNSMGVCPQHNILFKMMTVAQHLDFFIRLKGVDDDAAVKKEIEYMITSLGLEDKRDTPSHKLSGGKKRKLSVGIALCAGSKIVMLDEPSTGMDVSAKRDIWDILLKMKKGRTIIFTTHSMDEADLLGDRIAIMAAGDLVCSGSSMFLKRRYGVGYHLTLVKSSADMSDDAIEKLTHFIQSVVPSAVCHSNVGSELSYLLSTADVAHFVGLFQQLEEASEDTHGISSFGVSLTTMEEVFMKAGEGHDSNIKAIKEDQDAPAQSEHKIRKFDHSELNSGCALLWQQFKSQLRKRAILCRRNKILTVTQILAPIFFVFLGLTSYISLTSIEDGLPIETTLKAYPSADLSSTLYFADMRDENRGNYTTLIRDYLVETLDVSFTDISSESVSLRGNYSGDTASCCSNPYLQLSEDCINSLTPTKYQTCYQDYPDQEFTYSACREECFEYDCSILGCGDCPVKEEPLVPIIEDVEEQVNYYQNYFMKLADDYKGSFYIDTQGGLTLSDRSAIHRVYDLYNGSITSETDVASDKITGLGDQEDVITGWVSYQGYHLLPAFQAAISNIIFQMNGMETRVTVTNEPLPETLEESFVSDVEISSFMLMGFFSFGFAFLLGAYSQVPVDERTNNSKHLQQISGVNSNIYWLAMYCWDYLVTLVVLLCIFLLIICFNVDGLAGSRALPLLLLFVLAGFACIPLVYLLSQIFSKTTAAYGVILVCMHMLTVAGYLTYIIVYELYEKEEIFVKLGEEESNKYAWIITFDRLFLIHPPYAVVAGMNNLIAGKSKADTYDACSEAYPAYYCSFVKPVDVFAMDKTGIGRHIIALVVAAGVYMSLLLIAQANWFRLRAMLMNLCNKLRLKKNRGRNAVSDVEDENVTAEREKVEREKEELIQTEGVVMYNLHRQFGSTTAVQNLSMAISKGECFGLLGVNGAGKTTTFNMMTGDTAPTSGEGYLYGHNVSTHLREAQQYIGYCPQFDALIGYLTGRELLHLFADLRGVPYESTEQSVGEVIKMFNLEDHADKECRSYSGGNKRKLSTGLAIIGSPPLIFLDEPTAGMDPTARRFLWDVLCNLRSAGCSIVLTSHSMEECEALCTKIVIMVNGANRCLGGIQELKTRYSQGYTVCMLVEPEDQDALMSFIDENFKGAVLKENYPGYLMYSLGTNYKWSHIFDKLETNKTTLKLLDYSVSQTTLEQVFLNFAKEQRSEKENKTFLEKLCSKLPCRKKAQPVTRDTRASLRKSFVSKNKESDGKAEVSV